VKPLLHLFILLFSTLSWSFEYKIDKDALLQPSILDAYEFKSTFQKYGYYSLSDTSLIQAGLAFDHAYVSEGWKSSFLLKAGLSVPEKMEGKVLKDQNLDIYVLHFWHENTPYLLMGLDMSEAHFLKVARPWIKKSSKGIFSMLSIISSAHADDNCELSPSAVSSLAATSSQLEDRALISKIAECGMDALKGGAGRIEETFDFFKKLATNPTKLWAETKESFRELKSFVLNIKSELQEVFQNLSGTDLNQKLALACSITGSMFVTAAQSMLMGPGALARALPLMMLKLKKTSTLLSQLGILKKQGVNLPDNKRVTSEVLSCVK
jgi:hypothetical protein